MKKLVTEFVKVGQSGATADGRKIEASWLKEAAETYDTAKYTALIWPDHFKWNNAGKVVELKVEESDGVTSLYAKLQPNELLLEYNKRSQKLFSSMELTPNFADSGKHYLSGLAVTDLPASLGTHELMFSQRKENQENVICCGVELPSEFKTEDPEEVPGWLQKFISGWSSSPQEEKEEPETYEEDSEEMNAEQLKQLTGSIDGLASKFSAMAEAMSQKPAEGKGEPEPEPEAPEGNKEFSELSTKVETLTKAVEDFTSRLEKANPGTAVPETPGAADQGGIY